MRVPGGGRLLPGCGASGVGRSPTPDCLPSGRAAGAHYPLAVGKGGCGRGDPSPSPQRALFRARFAHCGGGTRAPGGGRLLPGFGASGVGRSPTPECPPSGGAAGAHYPLAVGAGGSGRGDPSPAPQRAILRSDFARCGGGMRVPSGGRLLPGCGASGAGRSPSPDCPPSGRVAGAHYPLAVGAGGCARGDPSPTPQRALLRAGFARCGGGTRAPGGGRLLLRCGASGVGRSPTPDCPPSGRAAGAHYPLAVGAGGCRRGDPSQAPQHALLRAGFARCGGGMRVPGGAPLARVWGVRGRALSHPRLPALWAGCRGPLPTCRGCGGVRAWGPVTNPTARALASWLCALWGWHGGARGGASCLGVGRPRSGALPPPTARPLGGLPGPTTHWLWVRGAAGVGTRHQPHTRALASWLCALWGRHEGAREGRLLPGCGAFGVGRSPTPDCLPFWRAAGAHYPLAVGAGGCGRGDPSPTPQRALLRAGFARYGGVTRAPGGGRLLPGWWASGVRRSPTPDCPPSGRAAGAHYLLAVGAGGCGRGDPSPTPQRALLRAGFARCGGGTRARGGGRLLPGCGASGVRRSPGPDCPPSGRAAGAYYPLAVGAGGCGRGDPSPTPQRALLRAGFARCGGGMRVPRGGRLLPGCGASGVGRSPTPDCLPSGRAAGAHYPLAVGKGGCGRGDPSPAPQRALLQAGFARCGGGMRVPGGGRLLPGCGASGAGRSPSPDCPPSGRAAGAHYPLAVGAGGCGRGDPSPTPQRALLQTGFARCGGGMRVPVGAPLARVWGVRGRALSQPRLPALWAGCRGPLPTCRGCGGVRACGPVTNPTARALANWLCALWRQHEGARGGASCPGVGRPGSGALPPPTARPLGGLPGPTTHLPWVRGGAGVGTRHKPHSARSCELALRAVGAS